MNQLSTEMSPARRMLRAYPRKPLPKAGVKGSALGAASRFETNPPDVSGATFATPDQDSPHQTDVERAMTDVIVEIVDRLIAAEEQMLENDDYDWPTSRAALKGVLADLEARSLGHPQNASVLHQVSVC